jgi:poly(A) polymerase
MTRLSAEWLNSAAAKTSAGILNDAGFLALFVGGCVRNTLLNAPVNDLDLSTDATPDRVTKLAVAAGIKVIPTGIDHGTVTLIIDNTPVEVTTFRKDVETDGRHAVVAFATDVADDAARRDFTMNALYAGIDGVVVDPLDGLPDLNARLVRFVGHAQDRVREDYLRILRFFRFHAWYGGDAIDADSLAACAELADGLEQISAERIGAEIVKLLTSVNPAPTVGTMVQSGIMLRVLPGADAPTLAQLVHHEQAAGIDPDPMTRLAAITGDDMQNALRLSGKQARHHDGLRTAATGTQSGSLIANTNGAEFARHVLCLRAALLGSPVEDLTGLDHAAEQVFPITGKDVMDVPPKERAARLTALRAEWVASNFSLSPDDLLNR